MMAEPISIAVGGNSHWGIAIVDSDSSTADDLVLSNDVELNFVGGTVLDSGLEVGIRIEIEGEEHEDQGDRNYAFVSGSFGEFRIGNDSDMSEKMATSAPYASSFYGLNSPFWAANSISTFAGSGFDDGVSLLYFSPVINGFQFGVSYTPESGVEARSGNAANPEGGEVVSIGARYDGAFGDAGVSIAVGYASQDVPAGAGPMDAMDAMFTTVGNVSGLDLSDQDMMAIQTAIDAYDPDADTEGTANPLNEDGTVNFEATTISSINAPTGTPETSVVYTAATDAVPGVPAGPSTIWPWVFQCPCPVSPSVVRTG